MAVQRTYLLLDSTETFGGETYATILARLQTANASEVSYTITNTELSLPAGDADVADLRLVDCLIPNDERTAGHAAGDLSGIHRDNEDTVFFRMELATDAEIPLMGSGLLGRTGHKTQRFVRQEKSGGWGAGHGKTWRDAANGWGDTATLGATFVRDTRYWGCGFNFAVREGNEAFAAVNDMPAFPSGSGATVEWRMDYSRDPGMNFGGFMDTTASSNTWAQPDAANFPRVWKATWNNAPDGRSLWWLSIDPTLSTTLLYRNHRFGEAGSQTEVENNALSAWVDGSDVWVHMSDDSDPTGLIGRGDGFAYNPGPKTMDATTAKEDFDFINCQFIGGHYTNGGIMNGDSASIYPKERWLGGRYLFGCSWKPSNACISGSVWGRSTNGQILWDTSDRPSPTDPDILTLVGEHGSDQKVWNEIDRFIEIDSARNGVYWIHMGVTDNPDDGLVSGVLARNIGTVHPEIAAQLNNSVNYNDGDAHALATQGGSNWTCEYFLIENAGSAANWYSIADTTNSQFLQDNIFQDFIIRNSHGKHSVSSAGMNGVNINGDNDSGARTAGNGIKSGNIIRRFVIGRMIGDPDSVSAAPAVTIEGEAIAWNDEQVVDVSDGTIRDCDHGFVGTRTFTTDATYTRDPALLGPQIKVRRVRFVRNNHYCFWYRSSNWEDVSPANIGYVDSNDNEIIVKSSEVAATALKWRMVNTEQNFSTWQAETKSAPPGDVVSVYDPNSSVS